MCHVVVQLTERRINSTDDDRLIIPDDRNNRAFMPKVDYFESEGDRRDDFEYFLTALKQLLGEDADSCIESFYTNEDTDEVLPEAYIIFKPGFKKRYFEQQFLDFQNKIPKNLDDFVNASDLYEMEEIVGNYFGAYIADELKEPQPINVFLKSPRIDDAKETKLYLGAAFRYYW